MKLINSVEDLKGLKHGEEIRHKCKRCGKLVTRQWRYERRDIIKRLMCHKCNVEVTNLTKYGVKTTLLVPEVQEKIKETNITLYGVDNVFKSGEFRNKIIKGFLDKYGCKNPSQNKDIQAKVTETNLRKYGNKCSLHSVEVHEKVKESLMAHYGVDNPFKSKEVREKSIATNLRKYGVKNAIKSKEVQEKIKQIMLDKYGVDHHWKSPEIRKKIKETTYKRYGYDNVLKHPDVIKHTQNSRGRKYLYNGENFDSSWELALWIYAKDHNEYIKRIEEPFEYYDGNKKHYYFPDFKYKDCLIEIKGELFMNNDTMVNPFDHTEDDLFAAKQQCAIDHNVKFMFEKDLRFAIDYAERKFGNDPYWYRKFNVSKNIESDKPFKLPQSAPSVSTPSTPSTSPDTTIPHFPPVPLFPQSPIQCMVYPYQLPFYYIPLPMMFNPFMVNTFTSNGIEYIEPDDEGVSPFDCLD